MTYIPVSSKMLYNFGVNAFGRIRVLSIANMLIISTLAVKMQLAKLKIVDCHFDLFFAKMSLWHGFCTILMMGIFQCVIDFEKIDIIRHKVVSAIVEAYERAEKNL